jgi:hypothetical protein
MRAKAAVRLLEISLGNVFSVKSCVILILIGTLYRVLWRTTMRPGRDCQPSLETARSDISRWEVCRNRIALWPSWWYLAPHQKGNVIQFEYSAKRFRLRRESHL